ncbi:O-antigen ligase family protein [Haloferula sargassicola]|uniref:O-antigen ligase-related domain-containing protein n=1 Tax=Haloferula sargassicola TaxID=490096 RepID=A0ABP9UWI5_9BACT
MPFLFLGFLICLGLFGAGLEWHYRFALELGGVGMLMMVFRPVVALPKLWWWLGIGVLVFSAAGFFLGRGWVDSGWREAIEAAGVPTGDRAFVQPGYSAETWVLQAMTLMAILWVATQRTEQPLKAAGGFALGVAVYAILSKVAEPHASHFGFLANRNHTATLLAMGVTVGLGGAIQSLREKQWGWMAAFVAAVLMAVWAILIWSISRAGFVLLGVGAVGLFIGLGPKYLGKQGRKLVVLGVIALVGAFVLGDWTVKQRLVETTEKVGAVAGGRGDAAEAGDEAAVGAEDLDFRVPTMLDTVDMIGANPWTGVGAGQFEFVFPQYRDRAAVVDEARNIHPESDWLWMASESGVPAALAFLLLVVVAFALALPKVLRARSRAVRMACLVAAGLLAFHGWFDIPGHVVPLVLAAVGLYSVALPWSEGSRPPVSLTWVFRLVGGLMVAAMVWAILDAIRQRPSSDVRVAERAREEVSELLELDATLMQAAEAAGEDYQPEPDPLEKALGAIGKAIDRTPLDPDLRRLQGSLALQFDDKQPVVEEAFLAERALLPGVVAVRMAQAGLWNDFDVERTEALWREAMELADRQQAAHPGYRYRPSQVISLAKRQSGKSPELKRRVSRLESGAESAEKP